MIRINGSPDTSKWKEFIYNHPFGNIFQTLEMAKVYKNTKNYEPISLAAIDEKYDEILGILLGVVISEKNGLLKTLSSRLIVQGGPLFQDTPAGQNAATLLINHYDEIVRKKGLYNEIRMLSDIPQFDSIITNCDYIFENHYNAFIHLKNRSIEELWKQIKRDKKRGIKKAEQSGITIEECNDINEIEIVYKLISETYKVAQIPLADISLFKSVFDILVPRNMALILFAKYKGKYIATQVALMDKKTVYAWYTGSSRQFLSYHPGDLLIWHLLKWGIENKYSIFDFGGGGSETKNTNLREYKQRFGTEFPDYGRYNKVYSPYKMNISKIGFNIYKRICIK